MPKTSGRRGGAGREGASIRVLIVDDHLAFAEALGMAVDIQDDLSCVGIAGTVAEAEAIAADRAADVVLMDLHLPDADGIEGTRRIKALRPQTRVVVVTADRDRAALAGAAWAGAAGFLVKDRPVADILQAIRTAGEGGMLVEASTLRAVLAQIGDSAAGGAGGARQDPLTPREHEVLARLGSGLDPSQIAQGLGIGLPACRAHVRRILAKLGAHSQLEAVVTALREGIISAPSG